VHSFCPFSWRQISEWSELRSEAKVYVAAGACYVVNVDIGLLYVHQIGLTLINAFNTALWSCFSSDFLSLMVIVGV
jgi:hypothetical protein